MNIIIFIAIAVLVCAIIYILYCQGFAVLRRTAAIIFDFVTAKMQIQQLWIPVPAGLST